MTEPPTGRAGTPLQAPLRLPCGLQLRNRLVKAAMSEQLAERDGGPGDALWSLYRRWSDCGAALLITGNVMIDAAAISEPRQVVVEDARHRAALARWVETAERGGAVLWMQINHGGRQVPRTLARRALAPSAIGLGPLFATPMAMQAGDIAQVVRRYARTAAIAADAGFRGVQIHAAHGYLLSQFLSPLANRRSDGYGGSPGARRRLLLEVIGAVRDAVGPRVAVGVKINSADFQRDGAAADEALDTARALNDMPIDLLEISGGSFHAAAMLGVPARAGDAPPAREAYFLEFATRARREFTRPLMLTGGFRTRATMQAALQSGTLDLLGLARPLVVDAMLPSRLLGVVDEPDKPDEPADAPLGPGPRGRLGGLWGGLAEIAWYTTQLWRAGRGLPPDLELGRLTAVLRYLGGQVRQQLGSRRGPPPSPHSGGGVDR